MIYVDAEKCDGCGLCVEACPQCALKLVDGVVTVDLDLCKETGTCLNTCPQSALFEVSEFPDQNVEALQKMPSEIVERPETQISRGRSPAYLASSLGAAIHFILTNVVPELWHLWAAKRQTRNRTSSMTSSGKRYGFRRGRRKRRRRNRQGGCA